MMVEVPSSSSRGGRPAGPLALSARSSYDAHSI